MMKTYASMHFRDISHQKIPGIYLLRMEEKSQKCKNNKNKTLVINNTRVAKYGDRYRLRKCRILLSKILVNFLYMS